MEPGIPFDSDLIKCCPMCNVPIEKDEGCAQMMCKRCKHVFCWYCLASLDVSILDLQGFEERERKNMWEMEKNDKNWVKSKNLEKKKLKIWEKVKNLEKKVKKM